VSEEILHEGNSPFARIEDLTVYLKETKKLSLLIFPDRCLKGVCHDLKKSHSSLHPPGPGTAFFTDQRATISLRSFRTLLLTETAHRPPRKEDHAVDFVIDGRDTLFL